MPGAIAFGAVIVLEVCSLSVGVVIVVGVLLSAIRTVAVPRGEQTILTRATTAATLFVFRFVGACTSDPDRRDQVVSRGGPISLVMLPVTWAIGVIVGYVPIYWALGVDDLGAAVELSGSSLTTLGFRSADGLGLSFVAISEALLGLGLVALLLSFLPTIYTHFAEREELVNHLESRAGLPPTPEQLFIRLHRIGWMGSLDDTFASFERWFARLGESHSTFPTLVFFRSSRLGHSWIDTARCVLDSAALAASTLRDVERYQAALCIRAGYLALRRLADYYGLAYDPEPRPDGPISVSRAHFDETIANLAAAGVPLKDDLDQCWADFAGWRVNYDDVLTELERLVALPSSPRAVVHEVRPLLGPGRGPHGPAGHGG